MRSFVFFLAVAASTVFAFPTKRDFVSTPATGTQGGGQCNIGFDCCGGTLPDGRQFSCACPPLEQDVSSSTLQKCLKYANMFKVHLGFSGGCKYITYTLGKILTSRCSQYSQAHSAHARIHSW